MHQARGCMKSGPNHCRCWRMLTFLQMWQLLQDILKKQPVFLRLAYERKVTIHYFHLQNVRYNGTYIISGTPFVLSFLKTSLAFGSGVYRRIRYSEFVEAIAGDSNVATNYSKIGGNGWKLTIHEVHVHNGFTVIPEPLPC